MKKFPSPLLLMHKPSSIHINTYSARCRSYSLSSWNPFSPIRSNPIDTDSTPDYILETRQLLRSSPSQDQLAQTMMDLIKNQTITADSLTLMSQILKKLKIVQSAPNPSNNEDDSEVAVNEVVIIPGFTTQQSFDIFKLIIDDITQDNFQSARFIPRFYLQLLANFQTLKDKKSYLETVRYFLRYLFVLNQEEGQMVAILRSLVNDTSHGLFEKTDIHEELVRSLSALPKDLIVSPALLISVYDLVSSQLNKSNWNSFVELSIDRLECYLRSRNQIFTLNPQYLHEIQNFIDKALISNAICNIDNLIAGLELALLEPIKLEEQHCLILQKLSHKTKTLKKLGNDGHLSRFIEQVLINFSMKKEEKIPILSPLMLKSGSPENEEQLAQSVSFQLLKNETFNDAIKETVLNNKELVTTRTLNLILATISTLESSSLNFDVYHREIIDWFKLDINTETIEILLNVGIKTFNYQYLKDVYNYGLTQGLDYTKMSPSLLNQFFCTICANPQADIFEIFQWSKKIKRFVNILNAASYDSLMKLILKNEFIEDAIKSFTKELPELKNPDIKFQVSNYPELFHTIYYWIQKQTDPKKAELVWFIYCELQVYFDIPYECYFPLIKKFHELKATELSFQIFQKVKKNHRLFGTPPPTSQMYVYLFDAFSDEVYQDGIETLYAILKIDLSINMDIDIMNSLLNAFCNLRMLNKVSDIFHQIQTLPAGDTGINHQTISLMIKSQGLISNEAVDEFWNNIHFYGILPNSDNLTQYIIAKSHNGADKQEILSLLQSSDEKYDIEVTTESIQKLYKWFENDQPQQKLLVDWASSNSVSNLNWKPASDSLDVYKTFSKDEVVISEMQGMGFSEQDVRYLEFGRSA